MIGSEVFNYSKCLVFELKWILIVFEDTPDYNRNCFFEIEIPK